MTEDSLKDSFDDHGAGAFQDAVYEKYDTLLARDELFGEALETPDLHMAVRKYDHGQASNKTVTEYGVKIVFNSEAVELDALEDGGSIKRELLQLAEKHINGDIEGYDVTFVTEDAYEVWILLPDSFF